MIAPPIGTRVWLAAGITDMRKGMTGLAALTQTALAENPFSGHLFVFRGKRGDLIKVLWWSGDGMCLFVKRLERGLRCRGPALCAAPARVCLRNGHATTSARQNRARPRRQ